MNMDILRISSTAEEKIKALVYKLELISPEIKVINLEYLACDVVLVDSSIYLALIESGTLKPIDSLETEANGSLVVQAKKACNEIANLLINESARSVRSVEQTGQISIVRKGQDLQVQYNYQEVYENSKQDLDNFGFTVEFSIGLHLPDKISEEIKVKADSNLIWN